MLSTRLEPFVCLLHLLYAVPLEILTHCHKKTRILRPHAAQYLMSTQATIVVNSELYAAP